MRYVQLIILSVILTLFSSMFSSTFFQIIKIDRKLELVRKETDSLIFISESFCNSCSGVGFDSLEEWKRVCSDMFQLETIEWFCCDNLYCGKWSGPYGSGEVYAKR